jgi:hypothetical protein
MGANTYKLPLEINASLTDSNTYMTQLNFLRNTGLCRQRLLRTAFTNNSCRYLSKSSLKPSKAGSRDVKAKARGKASLQPGEVLPEVPAGDLPPIDMWRKYFPIEKASGHRCSVRRPETAAMLADAFVPDGSKDKIIIEASPGVLIFQVLSFVVA